MGGRFISPLEHRPHSVAMRCPSRGGEGLSEPTLGFKPLKNRWITSFEAQHEPGG